MSSITGSIIFAADIHLGRRSSRLPGDLEDFGVSPGELTPAAAWREVVRAAIEQRVAAVVLAGDVIDADNGGFEAFGPLKEGVDALGRAGIETFAVAGNHDARALPRLERALPALRVLGRSGSWEVVEVVREGRTFARLIGWSFPDTHVCRSPFEGAALPLVALSGGGVPVLGVLHGDLGAAQSRYAPVRREELAASGVGAWFLGHVHQPSPLEREPVGYLGSVVGLDPSESGARGAWRVDVRDDGALRAELLPVAPLRWETLALDASAIARADDILPAAGRALESLHRQSEPARLARLRAVGCEIRLAGRSALRRELRAVLARSPLTSLRVPIDRVLYFVHAVSDESRPALELDGLARQPFPAGLLARELLALEGDGKDGACLVAAARAELEPVESAADWQGLPRRPLDDGAVRKLLLRAGYAALEDLLEQVEARP